MENKNYNLEYTDILEDLRKATVDSNHPYRYAGLSTVNIKTGVRSRIVILRQLTPQQDLLIYTDHRSGKAEEIYQDSRVSLLCYNPTTHHQVRIEGIATIIKDGDLYNQHLEKVSLRGSNEYNTLLPPGSPIMQEGEIRRQSKLAFCLISIKMTHLEYLEINRTGHLRFSFKKTEEIWKRERLIP